MQGVAWRSVDYNGIQVDATLLFIVVRNTELMKKAGDPAFALLFIGSCFQLFSVYALYLRWAGRESRFPHNAVVRSLHGVCFVLRIVLLIRICRTPPSLQACMTLFGISSIFTFLSFVVFSGIVNTNPAPSNPIDQSGHYGSGFGLTIYRKCAPLNACPNRFIMLVRSVLDGCFHHHRSVQVPWGD